MPLSSTLLKEVGSDGNSMLPQTGCASCCSHGGAAMGVAAFAAGAAACETSDEVGGVSADGGPSMVCARTPTQAVV